jgi:hypothetical protein
VLSTGPIEGKVLTFVRAKLNDRRGTFGNRERLNRLLMLIQMHLNKQAREQAHTKIIREELLKNGGHSLPRRQILDP